MDYHFREELFPSWRGGVPWQGRIRPAQQALLDQHPGLDLTITEVSYDRFEAGAGGAGPFGDYRAVPQAARDLLGRVPSQLRSAYLGGLLLWNMACFERRFTAVGLDPALAPHYADAFHRLLDTIESDLPYCSLDRDAFLKDLWLTRAVMIPAFAQVWWPHSGIGKRALVRGGLDAASRLLSECRGLRPFFEGHTHDPVAKAYWNPNGWVEALRIAAVALRAYRGHRGVFGTAWFYDPEMSRVSPRLEYVAEQQVRRGALRFPAGATSGALRDALATSPTRRELHAQGRYTPTDYTVVWSRAALERSFGMGFRDNRLAPLRAREFEDAAG